MKYITLLFSLICIGFFIIQTISPGFTDALVLNQQSFAEPYRFVTAIFLHGSFTHLIFNLFALILFGLILESLIKEKILWVFLFSGVLGNIVSVFFYPSSLGASGAIFGIIGCLTILKPNTGVFVFGIIAPLWVASILWIGADLLGLFMPSDVGHIAHLSGVALGIIFGFFFRRNFPKVERKNRIIWLNEKEMREWESRFMD